MSYVTFIVNKDSIEKEYSLENTKTINDFKNMIIKYFYISSIDIDIDFQLERPIRSLGKFNIEPGILPRPLDIYKLERFGIQNKVINATFIPVEEYSIQNNKPNTNKMNKEYFNIHSEEDFPKLGS